MNNFDDDEIIDLEEELDDDLEFIDLEDNQNEDIETPSKKESPSFFDKNKLFNKNKNLNTQNKLQNIRNNNSFPINNLINNKKNDTDEEKNSTQEALDDVKTKVASKAIEAYTGGVVHGKAAETVADLATKLSDSMMNKYKKYILIASLVASVFLILLLILFITSSSKNDLGKNTYTYVTGETTEEDLYNQLEYYGYCKNEASCKKKGIYKFYVKLKDIYDEYQKECTEIIQNDKPCGISLNTGLIIETINYYENNESAFDNSNIEDEEINSVIGFFSSLSAIIKRNQQINDMINDIDDLALAQAEYVKETCEGKTKYYYQISFDKYISYLKYGNSSTHPNYDGKPVEVTNEVCTGPVDDNISTDYDSNIDYSPSTDDSKTMGQQIVDYALNFVGNPYVWGGTSLTNGADCSGFTMGVYGHFGIVLPHHSISQANYGTNIGTDVNIALPGDLIVYNEKDGIGHVAIYMGNNKIVHAASKKEGIKVSNNAAYRSIKAIVRLWR